LISSLALTPLCRTVSRRTGYIAVPREDRWHRRPTARLGGVSIAVTVLGLGAAIRPFSSIWPLLAAGGLLAAFGFVDDILHLKASTKLIAQILVASVLLFVGYRLHATTSMIGDG